MTEKIFRNYLEITSLEDFNETKRPAKNFSVDINNPKDFQLNKFFYKKIGKDCQWIDRLIWTDLTWTKYVSNENLSTYILKDNDQIAGYFELIYDQDSRDAEIAYLGVLEEYLEKKLGGYLLSEAIRYSFSKGATRVWVHTCSLDHKNALKNYLSRGMKIFKSETLIR